MKTIKRIWRGRPGCLRKASWLLILVALGAQTLSAGEYLKNQAVTVGGASRTVDLINMKLKVPATFTQQDVDEWRGIFEEGSRRIWDYTEKQTALGRIEVYRLRPPGDHDVLVEGTAGASANLNGLDGFLSRFKRIYMPAADRLGFVSHRTGGTLAHESGHYVFGLSDEYLGVVTRSTLGITRYLARPGNNGVYDWNLSKDYRATTFTRPVDGAFGIPVVPYSPSVYGADLTSHPAQPWASSIMCRQGDPGSTEVGTPNRTVMGWPADVASWASAHRGPLDAVVTVDGQDFNVQVRTWQDIESAGKSAWEIMVQKRSLTPLNQQPVDNSADYATEWPPLEWVLAEIQPSVMISLDRSGSMGPNFYQAGLHLMPLAISAAGKAIDNAATRQTPFLGIWGDAVDGDKVGISSYASDTRIDAALVEMVNKATKASQKASIAGMNASGVTAIGAGLRRCLNELIDKNGATPPPGAQEFIFLLSDGEQNTGEDPEGAILTELRSRKVKVHTIALGPAVDAGLMGRLAVATGGESRRITDASDLDQFYTEIYTKAREASALESLEGSIESSTVEHQVVVDAFGNLDLTANLFWQTGDLDLHLVKPDGTVIDHTLAQSDPDIEFIESARSEFIRVKMPTPGVWTVRVIPVGQPGSQVYTVQMSSVGELNMQFNVATEKRSYTHPDPLIIQAGFSGPYGGVKGVAVSGYVVRPDGSEVPFRLYDDGDPAHGDEYAGDGIYANRFAAFRMDGEYRFVMTANNVDGMTVVPGDSPDFVYSEGSEPIESAPVPPFSRQQTITVYYDGIPEFINVTPYTTTDFATWQLDRSSGAMVGGLVVSNHTDSVKTLMEPFWYAATETVNIKLANPDGYTDDGDPYVDITAKVNAALQAKYGRQSMAPGEFVVMDGIKIYSRDRSVPEMSAVWSLWADPPGTDQRRADNYDVNADGMLDDSEVLLAVRNWYAGDMPDFDLLRRVELWKQGR